MSGFSFLTKSRTCMPYAFSLRAYRMGNGNVHTNTMTPMKKISRNAESPSFASKTSRKSRKHATGKAAITIWSMFENKS